MTQFATSEALSARVYRLDGTAEWCSSGRDDAPWTECFERVRGALGRASSVELDAEGVTAHRLVDACGRAGERYLLVARRPTLPEWLEGVRLTPRQHQIADLAACGATTVEIAAHLGISHNTVRHHLKHVYRDLAVGNRVELARAIDLLNARAAART